MRSDNDSGSGSSGPAASSCSVKYGLPSASSKKWSACRGLTSPSLSAATKTRDSQAVNGSRLNLCALRVSSGLASLVRSG